MKDAVGWLRPGAAEVYATTFAPLCAGTVDDVLRAAGIPGSDVRQVLDVGTGTGSLAAAAAHLGAAVTAVDPDPDMVRLARAATRGVDVQQAGLPLLPFAHDTFDAVLANFVVNHVADPAAAVRELTRVTAPGGRVVVTIWPSGRTEQSRIWQSVIAESGAVAPRAVALPAEADFERTRAGLRSLLEQAGLEGVVAQNVSWVHRGEPDAFWRGAAAGIGGIGAIVTAQSQQVRALMEQAFARHSSDLVLNGRMVLRTEAILAVGTKAV